MRHRTTRHELESGVVRIRPALPDDAPTVERLVEAVILEDRWFLTAPDEWTSNPTRRAASLGRMLDSPTSLALVAVRGRDVLGFVQAQGGHLRRTAHESHLDIYVDATARGGGIGRTLLTELVRRARQRPAMHRIALAVFADNVRAATLYEAIGFATEGRRKGASRDRDGTLRDEILMALDVGEAR